MKTQIVLMFNTEQRAWPFVRRLFNEAGCDRLVTSGPSPSGFYAVKFDETDPSLAYLRAGLSSADISWRERREYVFTKAELSTASLLLLNVQGAEKGMGGPTYGTVYDLSQACKRCGTGAVQTSPLRLKSTELPRKGDIFQTLDGEILVSSGLADALRAAGVAGLELRTAEAYGTGVQLPWVQLVSNIEMPPFLATSKGILRENSCSLCGRDGYFHSSQVPVNVTYSAKDIDLDKLPDVVHTWECFGNSVLRVPFNDSHFAAPLIVVKPQIFGIFQEHKVKGVEFIPVTLT